MEAIASRVGISATALYRHYPSKYDLFRDAVLALGEQLVGCTAFADEAQPDAETLRGSSPRSSTPRWPIASRAASTGGRRGICAATTRPPSTGRCERSTVEFSCRSRHFGQSLSSRQRWMLVVVDAQRDRQHRRPPREAARDPHSCRAGRNRHRHLDCRRARPARRVRRGAQHVRRVDSSKYEALLTESVRLFNRKGYRDTTMEEIASAVGMPTSGIYRYFSGKNDILAAIYRRAADRLSSEASSILGSVSDPEEALTALIDAYVTEVVRPPGTCLRLLHRTGQHGARRPEDPAQPAEGDRRVVGAVGDRDPVGLDARAGTLRRARRHGAGDRRRPAGALRQHRASRVTVGRLLDLTLLGRYRLRTTLPAR